MVPCSRFCLLLTLSQCLMHKHFFFVLTSLSLKLIWKNLFAGSESFSRYRVTCIHSPDKCKYSELCSNQQTVWTLYILSRLWNRSEKLGHQLPFGKVVSYIAFKRCTFSCDSGKWEANSSAQLQYRTTWLTKKKQRRKILWDSLTIIVRPWNGTSELLCQLGNFPPSEVRQRKLPRATLTPLKMELFLRSFMFFFIFFFTNVIIFSFLLVIKNMFTYKVKVWFNVAVCGCAGTGVIYIRTILIQIFILLRDHLCNPCVLDLIQYTLIASQMYKNTFFLYLFVTGHGCQQHGVGKIHYL